MNRYVKFYDDPFTHYYHRDKYDRYHQKYNNRYQNDNLKLYIELTPIDESVKGPVHLEQSNDKN